MLKTDIKNMKLYSINLKSNSDSKPNFNGSFIFLSFLGVKLDLRSFNKVSRLLDTN